MLDYMFAMGTDFDFLLDHTGKKSQSSVNNTKAMQELLHEQMNGIRHEIRFKTCYGTITLWSDSFLLRFLRQRENSIWLLVVRISAPPGMSTSRDHMFCLAFGSSKLKHDKVIAHYIKKIKFTIRLGKERYWSKEGVKCMVNTVFDLGAFVGDTPEKNEIIKSLHLGHFHPYFCLLIMWDECVNSILAAATPTRKTNRRAAFIQTKRLLFGRWLLLLWRWIFSTMRSTYYNEDSFFNLFEITLARHRPYVCMSGQGLKRDKHSIIKFTETYNGSTLTKHIHNRISLQP